MQKVKRICLRITPGRIIAAILMATSAVNLIIVKAAFDISSVASSPLGPDLTTTFSLATATGTQSPSSTSPPTPTITLTPQASATIGPSETPTLTPSPTLTPTLCVPRSDWFVYVVQPGEYLSLIAHKTGASPADLRAANCLTSDIIFSWQRLYVPHLPPTHTPTSTNTPVRLPDLVVASFQVTGPAEIYAGASLIAVPVLVVVQNQGEAVANIFKLSARYSGPYGSLTVPFSVAGAPYPFVTTTLVPGQQVTITGPVLLSQQLQGQTVILSILADSCSGDEMMPAYCRVMEGNEGNNESISIPVRLSTNYPPTVFITIPQADTSLRFDTYDQKLGLWFVNVSLSGLAADVEDGTLSGSSLTWTTDRSDIQKSVLGTGTSLNVTLYANDCRGHIITLTAVDSDGNVVTATRKIDVTCVLG